MISEQEIIVFGDKKFVNQATETEEAFNPVEYQSSVSPNETLTQLRLKLQDEPYSIKIVLKEIHNIALLLEYNSSYDVVNILEQCVDIGKLCIDGIDKTPDDYHDIYAPMLELMRAYYLALKAQGSDEKAHDVMQQLIVLNDRYNEKIQIDDKLIDILPTSARPTFSASDKKTLSTQTSMTLFAQRPLMRKISHWLAPLSSSELEARFYALQAQLTTSGNHHELKQLQQIMWSTVIQMIKKNPLTRTYSIHDEMIKMLELALSIQVTYIIYYKPASESPYRLTRALQSNAKLFRLFNDYYQRTDAASDLKAQLLLNVEFMHQQATNVRHILLCEDVLNNETLTHTERTIALEKLNLSLGDWTAGFKDFMISQNNVLLGQSILKVKTIIETLTELPCSEYDCVEYINGNPTHNELALVGQLHLISSSFKEDASIRAELWAGLQIYYQQKMIQFEKTIDIDMKSDQKTRNFIDHERFLMTFRKDAYRYLLSDNLMSDTLMLKRNCTQMLAHSDYLSPLLQALIKYHLSQIPPKLAISIDLKDVRSTEEITKPQNIPITRSKRKKAVSIPFVPQETILDAIFAQNIHRLSPEWSICKHKVELLLQDECFDEAMLFLQEWIQELNHDDLSIAHQFHSRNLFYATFYKALIYKAQGKYIEALSTLDQLEPFLSPKEQVIVRNYQQQQMFCERAHIHMMLEKRNGKEKSAEASHWFDKAKAVAQEINVPCFPALCEDLKHAGSDCVSDYQWTIDYLLTVELSTSIDDYSYRFFIEFYTVLADRLSIQGIETVKIKIYNEAKNTCAFSASRLVMEFEQALKIIHVLMNCSFADKNKLYTLELRKAKIYMDHYDLTRNSDDYKTALTSFYRVIKQVDATSSFAIQAQEGLIKLKIILRSSHEQRLNDIKHELTVNERTPKIEAVSDQVYDALTEKPFDLEQRKADMLKACTFRTTISHIRHVIVILNNYRQFNTPEEQRNFRTLIEAFDIGIGRWATEMKICFDQIFECFDQSFKRASSQHNEAQAQKILIDWCEWIKLYRLKIEHISSEQEFEYRFHIRRLEEGTTSFSPEEQQKGVATIITAEKEMLGHEYRRIKALMVEHEAPSAPPNRLFTSQKPSWLLRDIVPDKAILDLYACKDPSSDFNFGVTFLKSHRYWQALHYFYQVIDNGQLKDKLSKRLNHYFIGSILKWVVDVCEMPEFSEIVSDISVQQEHIDRLCAGLRTRSKSRFSNAQLTSTSSGGSVVNNIHLLFSTPLVASDAAQVPTEKNDIKIG